MEKSILLSNAAILAFLVIIASCCSFSLAAGEPEPVDDVPPQADQEVTEKQCSTDKDCKVLPGCIIGMHKCVNGTCQCVPFKPPQAPPPAFPMVTEYESCTTLEDCRETICPDVIGVHLRCIDGICKCVPDGSPPVTKPKASDGCPKSDCDHEIHCDKGCPQRFVRICRCIVPPTPSPF